MIKTFEEQLEEVKKDLKIYIDYLIYKHTWPQSSITVVGKEGRIIPSERGIEPMSFMMYCYVNCRELKRGESLSFR